MQPAHLCLPASLQGHLLGQQVGMLNAGLDLFTSTVAQLGVSGAQLRPRHHRLHERHDRPVDLVSAHTSPCFGPPNMRHL